MPRTADAVLLTPSMSLAQQDDATTAFEVGMFKYPATDLAGTITASYPRVEALLIKTNGRWQTLMEHQLHRSTESAWNQLPH